MTSIMTHGPTRSQGLTASLAAELLLRDGPNALRPPRGTPEYVKFARQLAGGLQCLMWVAAAICLIAFAIQASEGDLTTDDNVSGGCCGAGTGRREAWGELKQTVGMKTLIGKNRDAERTRVCVRARQRTWGLACVTLEKGLKSIDA